MNPLLTKIEDLIWRVTCAMLWASTAIIFVILCVNTILRYATGSSLQWANEVPELLFPWLVMSGVVMAAIRGAHITTSFLLDSVSPALRRWVKAAGLLTVAVVNASLAIATYRLLEIVHDEKSPILKIPGSVTYGCVMLGLLLLVVVSLIGLYRQVNNLDATNSNPMQPSMPPKAHF